MLKNNSLNIWIGIIILLLIFLYYTNCTNCNNNNDNINSEQELKEDFSYYEISQDAPLIQHPHSLQSLQPFEPLEEHQQTLEHQHQTLEHQHQTLEHQHQTLEQTHKKQNNQQYNIKIYNFYADWCGYSIQFKPIWNKFENKIKLNMNKYNIIDIRGIEESDCTEMCNKYNIQGFPTIIFDINDKPIIYQGERTVESLELFLTQKIYDYI
jgi:thiol-disulfide isomerase/thioredoxin